MPSWRKRVPLTALILVWSCALLSAPTAAQETRERALASRKLVVAVANTAPWGFKDPDGTARGFHPDLIRAAFQPLGIADLEVVITQFSALIPGLSARRFDVIAAGLYITPERCKLVAFSDPDLKLSDAALVLKGNPKRISGYRDIASRKDVTIGATRGSTTAKNAATAGIPESRQLLFQDTPATVSALIGGRIDVAVFAAPTVAQLVSDANLRDVERVEPFEGLVENGRERSGYSAVAFRPEDKDLRDLYNGRLMEMKADGTAKAVMQRYGFAASEAAPALTQAQICNGER